MTCYEIEKYGGPEGLKSLLTGLFLKPDDHEVVVRIKAASLELSRPVLSFAGNMIVSQSKGGYRFRTEPVKLWQSVRL